MCFGWACPFRVAKKSDGRVILRRLTAGKRKTQLGDPHPRVFSSKLIDDNEHTKEHKREEELMCQKA